MSRFTKVAFVLITIVFSLSALAFLSSPASAVSPVNSPPSFTKGADQTINEDAAAQTVNGWATNIDAGPGDAGQTLDFIVTNDNNQLFSAQPAVAPNGTLTYKSATNAFGLATVTVKLHDNGGGTDTSAPQTFKITVKPVADFATATPANTVVNTQTTSGLVINRNPVDGPEVTHFKFFSITNGRLFKHDGVTEIPGGGVITVAEGQAGLRFTPDPNLYSPQSFFLFVVVAGVGPAAADFGPGGLTVGIGVTCTEAQVFMVTNSNDSGPGSLRDVLSTACSGGKVAFDMSPGRVTSPITLTSGELAIGQDQTIAGPTDKSLVISGNNNSRVFNVNWWQANLKISNLTITGGKANSGAGIRSEGGLTIKDSTLTGNNAAGTDGSGGAIDTAFNSHLTIINSTISGNTAQGYGGGLQNRADDATLTNVTITNNRADVNGDGLEYAGGIIQFGSRMTLRNSLVAGNFKGTGTTPSDLTGNASDPYAAGSSKNLIGVNDASTGLDPAVNLLGSLASPINPLIGSLVDNGGPTKTHLLLLGSPAIKAGANLAGGNATDQRGFSRAVPGAIDIGAVETHYAINATGGTPQSAVRGTAFATPLQATVSESGIPKSGIVVTFAAPANGASGSFSGNAAVSTNANGVATAPVFTANSIVGGPYNVTASFAGGSSPAVFALTNTLPIAQVTLGNLLQTFDGTPKSVSVTTNPAGLATAVTYNGSATAPTNAGTYPVIATVTDPNFTGQANGNLVIQPANQQITFGVLPNKKFGDADFTVSATASSNLTVSFSASGSCTIANTLVHLTGAGSCTITASQAGNANWNPASPVARTFTIGKADQQITFAALPNKQLGDADFNVTATASSNLTVAFSAVGNCSVAGTLVHLTGAGSCTLTASQEGNLNYNPAVPVSRTFAITEPAPNTAVQFSSSNYSVLEDCTTLTITVNRVGDTSGVGSVDYGTSDVSATERKDYNTALGRLNFAPGETSKSFVVLVNEDSFVEGNETFNVNLTNPAGMSLGGPSIATVTITDDATEPSTNANDDAQNFVCQHYHDFLNRQPDAPGLAFWTNQITSCGADPQCIEIRRINVSASFFLSIEFQDTGYLVERIYKAAYGDATGNSTFPSPHQLTVPVVRTNEFLSDTREIGQDVIVNQGNWQQQLENNKQAFTAAFVQRSRFTTAFPLSMTAAQFVDKLNVNAGNPLSSSERNQLVNDLSTNVRTRAQVLRAIAEDADLNTAESNRAFVLMQYFGYLRRNPNDPQDSDHTGYDFWLTKLNQFNGNYINAEMVKAFITSIEYRQRFGQ